jgi:hypothetical protein
MNKRIIFSFFCFGFFLQSILLSQVQLEWVRRYPDTGSSSANTYAMVLDYSSNVYVTGQSIINSNNYNICTIKYNINGFQQWVAQYPGTIGTNRYANAIALDKYANIYVAGISSHDFCTIKYNSNGVQQWVQFYDGPSHGDDEAEKIAVDNAGNIYVSGYSDSAYNEFGYATIKYSSDGRQLWVKRYNGSGETNVNGLLVDDSCYVYLTGVNRGRAVTIKYDSSGNALWTQIYTGIGPLYQTVANDIAIDVDKNVYITGYSRGKQTYWDCLTIKYSYSGVQQWLKKYNADSLNNGSGNKGYAIALDSLNNIVISGWTGNVYGGAHHFCTIKYTNSGEIQWVKIETDTLGDGNINIAINKENNICISGGESILYSTNYWISIYETIMYNNRGEIIWKENYLYPNSNSSPSSLKIDNINNVFVTGSSYQSIATLKYTQTTGLKRNTEQIPRYFNLYQNYPNPFNPNTILKFDIPAVTNAKMVIYDISGKEVCSIILGKLGPGTYEINWNASNLSSGIYFYKLITNNYSLSKKMIVLK